MSKYRENYEFRTSDLNQLEPIRLNSHLKYFEPSVDNKFRGHQN